MTRTYACILLCALGLAAFAQDADRVAPDSRSGEIEAERNQKARRATAHQQPKIERILNTIKDKKVIERITNGTGGLRAHLGGLITGSGFAVGPEYYRRFEDDTVVLRSSVRGSLRKFWLADTGLSLPRLAGDHLFIDLYAAHRDYPHLDYYGPGPNSSKTGRSGYTLEDTTFDFRSGIHPVRHLGLGVLARYLLVNVGPGRDERFVSSDLIYSEASTPGILNQSDFLVGGGFIQYDTRDNPGGPRSGGNYIAQFSNYSDQKLGTGSFARVDLEAQRYISFTNQRRVIALRGRTIFTDPHQGRFVPFYLQPYLGGSDDLRGFRPFRFYDNNSIVMNAEYRWEVFSGLDMALFMDAGKVFHRYQDVSLDHLETSAGFGFRFNVRNDVFFRLDTGFSREGFQVWFKFNNVF